MTHNSNPTAHYTELNIRSAFQEVGSTIEWLGAKADMDDPAWLDVFDKFEDCKLARERFLEGEYQLAQAALPQF